MLIRLGLRLILIALSAAMILDASIQPVAARRGAAPVRDLAAHRVSAPPLLLPQWVEPPDQ